MTPRFLSQPGAGWRGSVQKGVSCEKCLLGIWETSLWQFREVAGSREVCRTGGALCIMGAGGL